MAIVVETDTHGCRILINDMRSAYSDIEKRIAKVHHEAGPVIVRAVQRGAPVDTGTLRRSIDYAVNVRQQTLRIGALRRYKNPKSGQLASEYLPFVHDGTSRMPPRPFITSAIQAHSGPNSKLMRGYAAAGVTPIDRKVSL